MSIAKQTKEYIQKNPSIVDCFKLGIINYSALSRLICDYYKIKNFEAVLISCRRIMYGLKDKEIHQKKIVSLLKSSKIRIRNKMLVAIIEKPRDMEKLYSFQKKIRKDKGDINLIEGEDVITIITNLEYEEKVKELFSLRLIKLQKNLVQLTLVFNEKIEETSGVVSYVYGLLAQNGINIKEEMSCWTDLMLIIEGKDMAKATEILTW